MKINPNAWPWIIATIILITAVYLIRGILLPFVAGMFLAYAMSPAVTYMEKHKVRRSIGTLFMLISFFLVFGALLFILIPFITNELILLAGSLPQYGQRLIDVLLPYMDILNKYLGNDYSNIQAKASGYIGDMFSWALRVLAGLLTNTLALANLISLIVITPIVTFYLLRDWPIMLDSLSKLLPQHQAPVIKDLAVKINNTLGGYVRGQSLVCLIQAFTYSLGLWIVGLDYAITIGIVTGLLSFIPYVGMLIGVVAGLGIAFSQFDSWLHIGLVAGVFVLGNFFEGHVLAPNLVGGRIGLHPVWVIFALLAGGSLYGFVGMLFALPVAAAIGVVVRYFISIYKESSIYKGNIKASKAVVKQKT